MQLGVELASESRGARALVDEARTAQDHGFSFGLLSDHYFPWTREQGESPFVWTVLGALAEATDLDYITGVTCPTVRIHPAVIAEAVVCGPDPDRHVEAIRPFLDAGFTHLAIHQVMPGAAGFWKFYRDEVMPRL